MRSFKRTLSLVLAAILLASAMAIPSTASGVSVPTPTEASFTDTDISVLIPITAPNDGVEYQFCAILSSSTVPVEDTLKDEATLWQGSTANNISSAKLTKDYSGAMIGADASYNIYAKGYDTRTGLTYYNVTSPLTVTTLKSAPLAPLATEIKFKEADYNSITFDVQRSDCEYSIDGGRNWTTTSSGNLSINNLEHTTTYDVYFRVTAAPGQQVALVLNGNTLLVTAATLARSPWPKPTAPTTSAASIKSDSRISVVYETGFEYYLNGEKPTSTELFEVRNDQGDFDHNEIIFKNLTPGTLYKITRCKKATAEYSVSPASDSIDIRTKRVPAAPAAPTIKSVDDKAIIMNYSAGVEYSYTPEIADSWIRATVNLDGTTTNAIFRDLTPGNAYTIYARFYATNDNIVGPNSTPITVTTKRNGAAAPEKPVLVDKTTTTIQVQTVDGVEFCIGRVSSGTIAYSAWQNSGTFSGLAVNTNYSIKARYRFNPSEQIAGAESSVTIKTTERAGYAASIGKCSVKTDAEYIRLTDTFKITATGDTYSTKKNAIFVYGDTRLIPVAFYTSQDSTRRSINPSHELSFTFDVTPSAEGKLVVTVIYVLQKYNGSSWDNVKMTVVEDGIEKIVDKEVEAFGNFTVKARRSVWTNIADAFIKVLNVFTNTIPNLILGLINAWN